MKWTATDDEMPPDFVNVITWVRGADTHGHGHYDPDNGWFNGCECFPGDEPDFWMIPTSPESEA